MIHVRKNNGKVNQSIVQLIHQILCISACYVETDIRMLFCKICCCTRQIVKRPGLPGSDSNRAGNMVFYLADLILRHLHQAHHFFCPLPENHSFLGECNLPVSTHKKCCTEFFLQLLHLP